MQRASLTERFLFLLFLYKISCPKSYGEAKRNVCVNDALAAILNFDLTPYQSAVFIISFVMPDFF